MYCTIFAYLTYRRVKESNKYKLCFTITSPALMLFSFEKLIKITLMMSEGH